MKTEVEEKPVKARRKARETRQMLLCGVDGVLEAIDLPEGVTTAQGAVEWVKSDPAELAKFDDDQQFLLVRSAGVIKRQVETRKTVKLEES